MCLGDDFDLESPERRAFLSKTTAAAAAFATLAALRGTVSAQEQQAQRPPTRVLDAPNIQHGSVTFKSGAKEIDGYLARPKRKGRYMPVLVIAGNRITEEYIPNTCAALAVAGYVGLAPNIFHTVPDSARTPDEMQKALEGRTEDDYLQDIRAGSDYLSAQSFVKFGKTGIIGFCSGGRRAMLYGARYKDTKAVVPYHPARMKAEEVATLKAPVQIHQGTADRHIPVSWIKELEETFRKQNTPVEVYFYEGADHGFLAYTRPYYRPNDALLSWKRTTEFLNKHLKK
ncbi:MAG: dienelactone hydrolase family protein [Pyrinomonadaceae bacterium]|nr:dienelactone hydrolase family protein [Pyrinomonadaceae bacterium]